MPIITLPDGSKREFDRPVSVLEVAQDIGAGLAKATIAGRVNGERRDACDIINEDANLEIITAKDEDGLEIISSLLRSLAWSRNQTIISRCENGNRSND